MPAVSCKGPPAPKNSPTFQVVRLARVNVSNQALIWHEIRKSNPVMSRTSLAAITFSFYHFVFHMSHSGFAPVNCMHAEDFKSCNVNGRNFSCRN